MRGRIVNARVLLVCIFFFTLGYGSGAMAQDVPIKTIELMNRSVFPLVCVTINSDNEVKFSFIEGSGFFVDDQGDYATAGHVIDNWQQVNTIDHPCGIAVFVPPDGWRGSSNFLDAKNFYD